MSAAFLAGFVEGADWSVQDLILQKVERLLEVPTVFLGQFAIQLAQQLQHDRLALGVAVLRQAGDQRAVAAAGPVLLKAPHLLLDDRLSGADVLAALAKSALADRLQVVDVEKTRPVAVMDARVEVARHGDVENDRGAARALGENRIPAAARHDRLSSPSRAENDVGLSAGVVE